MKDLQDLEDLTIHDVQCAHTVHEISFQMTSLALSQVRQQPDQLPATGPVSGQQGQGNRLSVSNHLQTHSADPTHFFSTRVYLKNLRDQFSS